MHVLKHFLFLSLFIASVTAQRFFCPANMIQLYNGVSCSTDAMCAGLAPGFFCLNGFCCANTGSTGSIYGSACSSTSQCNYLNSDCVNNICVCQPAFDFDGTNCNYGTSATPPGSPNTCITGQVIINNVCYPQTGYYGTCIYTQQCNFFNATCQSSNCKCIRGTVFNGYGCIPDPDAYLLPYIPPTISPVSPACASNEVYINGACYPTAVRGQACMFDAQCSIEPGLRCYNGFCVDKKFSDIFPSFPVISPEQVPLVLPEPQPLQVPQFHQVNNIQAIVPPGWRVKVYRIIARCCYSMDDSSSINFPCCLACCTPSDFANLNFN